MSVSSMLGRLERAHGAIDLPGVVEPLHAILWENVAYLVDDDRRRAAFAQLEREVGLSSAAILAASDARLTAVAKLGGMLPQQRVARLREVALLAAEIDGDDLRSTLRMAPDAARKVFTRFPGIGRPGADKILLLAGIAPCFTLESNGLRVLLRLGFGVESSNYAASLRSAVEAVELELARTRKARLRAHLLLQRHGREVCKRTRPACVTCPLAEDCSFARGSRSG